MVKFVGSRRSALRIAADILAAAVGIVSLAFIIWVLSFKTRFYPNTYIEGINCSMMGAEKAAETVVKASEGRSVLFVDDAGNEIAAVPLAELLPDAEALTAEMQSIIDGQLYTANLKAIIGKTQSDYSISWPCGDALAAVATDAVGDWIGSDAVDSKIEVKDGEYVIADPQQGIKADTYSCAEVLAERLRAGDIFTADSVSLKVPTMSFDPQIGEYDDGLLNIMGEINTLTSRDVSLDFGDGLLYTLTAQDILSVYDIAVLDGGIKADLSKEKVYELFANILTRVPADGIDRKYYMMQRGENTHYNDWDTGYILDKDNMALRLWAQLLIGESGAVPAQYDYTSSCDAEFGVGDWFIEISIENQFMWVYKDGKLMVSTPIVSGDVATHCDTPTGVFRVSYTQQNTWLYGRNYSSHVDYWVPFFGNYGIHDSWWMPEYGGDIYQTAGSHGCINTPLEAMRILYENCEKLTPVVVY